MLPASATAACVLLSSMPHVSRCWVPAISAMVMIVDIVPVSPAVIPIAVSLVRVGVPRLALLSVGRSKWWWKLLSLYKIIVLLWVPWWKELIGKLLLWRPRWEPLSLKSHSARILKWLWWSRQLENLWLIELRISLIFLVVSAVAVSSATTTSARLCLILWRCLLSLI